jgi:amidase
VRIRLDPEIRSAVARLADVLRGLGHEVFEAEPHYAFAGPNLAVRGITGLLDWVPRVPDQQLLDHRTRDAFKTGRRLKAVLPAMRAAEPLLRRRIGQIFNKADVVLAPTTARPPLRIGEFAQLSGFATDQAMTRACPYAYAWNVTGWPGLNVPAGLTASGLPIGAQLLGNANSEALLLSLGAQLEAAERWHERRPPV